MKVLGIFDWHNCGAALVDGMEIIAAVEEERLSRRKVEFGLPLRSMDAVLDVAGADPEELDAIAVCGIHDPTPLVRWRPRSFEFERRINTLWWLQYRLWRIYYATRRWRPVRRAESWANRRIVRRQLARWPSDPGRPIHHVDHHLCHARLGFHTSGWDAALIFTIDGSGDGYSTAVFAGSGSDIRFVAGAKESASLGKLYANATLGLGFEKLTGEGKLMGLAALGDPTSYAAHVDRVLTLRNVDRLEIDNHVDLLGNSWALQVRRDARRYRREDIAAAVQARFEELVEDVVGHFVVKLGIAKVVLVGGAAMNVRMNQRVREMPKVESVFGPPAMTDAGVAAGAALDLCCQLMRAKGQRPVSKTLVNSYLGPRFSSAEIRRILERRGCIDVARRIDDIELELGRRVAEGRIVARFRGRMEHGPRALGHRSILALVSGDNIEETLNQRLGRDEFMPFAPSILEEHAAEYLEGYRYSPFMVETFDVKPDYRRRCPAVVHADGTLRPQIVRRDVAPGFWRLIDTVGRLTGLYMVLNTSFNLHGDPIVCAPEEALDAFERGAVDVLALEDWLLEYSPPGLSPVP